MAKWIQSQAQLRDFYESREFPVDDLWRWLNPGVSATPLTNAEPQDDADIDKIIDEEKEEKFAVNREFSFTFTKGDGQEFYKRWNCFANAAELRKFLLAGDPRIVPVKFDIGGVYSRPVSEKATSASGFFAVAREFVLDIDMDDYDSLRTCCEGKSVCSKCWQFIAAGALILNDILHTELGFSEILWNFSGRRGIHCWITDRHAKLLNNSLRSAIVPYLSPPTNSHTHSNTYSHTHTTDEHETEASTGGSGDAGSRGPSLSSRDVRRRLIAVRQARISADIRPIWRRILSQQNLFYAQRNGDKNLRRFEAFLRGALDQQFKSAMELFSVSCPNNRESSMLWDYFCQSVPGLSARMDAYMLAVLQPRLDVNVSKDVGHLLKAPFCAHQSTRKVCVPLSLESIAEFDPTDARLALETLDKNLIREHRHVLLDLIRKQEENRRTADAEN